MKLRTMNGLILAGSLALQVSGSMQTEEPRAKLVWGDFDRDGRVDVFSIDPLGEDLLLRNAGEGRFDDVTAAFGLPALKHVRSGAFQDFDGDGWSDLFLIPENGKGRLLRNLRGKLFEDVTDHAGLDTLPYAEQIRWQDFDQDGRVDLVLSGPLGDTIFRNISPASPDAAFQPALQPAFQEVELPRRVLPGLPTTVVSLGPIQAIAGGPARVAPDSNHGPRQEFGVGSMGGAIGPAGSPMQSATASPLAGGSGGSGPTLGPPQPTAGGGQPIVLDREIPSGFSILGPVDEAAPQGYMATGETVSSNGDAWFKPLPGDPGPDDLPDNRLQAGHAVANDLFGEKLFVFGGSQTSGSTHQTSGFKFDAEAPRDQMPPVQWANIAPLPQPARSNMATVAVDNLIYAIGGVDVSGPLDRVDIYDPMTDSWSSSSTMLLPSALRGAGAGAVGRTIYVFGGANGGPQSALLSFDLDAPGNGWVVLMGSGVVPTPRLNAATTVFDGKLYAIGGFGMGGILDVNEVYDPELNRWELKTPRPTSFHSATITVANGFLLIFGGDNPLPIGDVHQYDPQADNWTARESMITPRSKTVAGRLCKSTYVAGGEEEGPMPMPMPMPIPVNEEYLENQEDKAVFTKI